MLTTKKQKKNPAHWLVLPLFTTVQCFDMHYVELIFMILNSNVSEKAPRHKKNPKQNQQMAQWPPKTAVEDCSV